MRRISSKKEEQRRKKRNQIIIGIVLIVVMFGSVFGVIVGSFNNSESPYGQIKYNGIDFYNNGVGYWLFEAKNFEFSVLNNPEEIPVFENIEELALLESYEGKPLYIKSENSDAELEIYRNLFPIVLRIQEACLDGDECKKDLPIKDCSENFIIIETSNNVGITQDKNCVFIRGQEKDLIKLSDEFLFKITEVK